MAASTASQLSGNRSMLSVLKRNTGEQTVPVRDELKICKKKKEKTNIGVAGVADSCNMWLRLSPPILLSLNLHPLPSPFLFSDHICILNSRFRWHGPGSASYYLTEGLDCQAE